MKAITNLLLATSDRPITTTDIIFSAIKNNKLLSHKFMHAISETNGFFFPFERLGTFIVYLKYIFRS